jgi:hypothetical protein
MSSSSERGTVGEVADTANLVMREVAELHTRMSRDSAASPGAFVLACWLVYRRMAELHGHAVKLCPPDALKALEKMMERAMVDLNDQPSGKVGVA